MEILKNFGFEPTFFFAQIVNFLILAFVFQRFLYKPLLKLLKDRKAAIARGLKDAEDAHHALEVANQSRDEILKEATLEAEKIIDETKKAAEELREKMTATTREEAERIIREAKETASAEFELAKKDAESYSLDLSRKMLDKIIGEIFTKEEKEKIIQRNIKKISNYGNKS
ncbi:MAG TPA: F0F1 ATP synthase subunit B [Patescibacteria group bacterium]|nr:F0F1 ATP synthase subunit B [Patescibacteria group bacterium]